MAATNTSQAILAEIEHEDRRSDAVYQFNKNPKIGVYKLCEYYKVQPTPHIIAHLLHHTTDLSDVVIGDYLTSSGNEQILDEFFNELDLHYDLISAMRACFCEALHMPSDSNKVDAAISSMARIYLKQNPGSFPSSDVCYSLVYLIILLNSDINNPTNPKPMSLQQFIENSRQVISQELMDDNKLKGLYNDVKSRPFTFRTEHAGNFLELCQPSFKGNLKKRTDSWKSFWTEHFFVLANCCLYYFQSDLPIYKDHPKGCIQLVNVTVTKGPGQRMITLEHLPNLQYMKFQKRGPVPVYGVKKIFLQAPDQKLFRKWVYRIQTAANFTIYYPLPQAPPKPNVDSNVFNGTEVAKKLGTSPRQSLQIDPVDSQSSDHLHNIPLESTREKKIVIDPNPNPPKHDPMMQLSSSVPEKLITTDPPLGNDSTKAPTDSSDVNGPNSIPPSLLTSPATQMVGKVQHRKRAETSLNSSDEDLLQEFKMKKREKDSSPNDCVPKYQADSDNEQEPEKEKQVKSEIQQEKEKKPK